MTVPDGTSSLNEIGMLVAELKNCQFVRIVRTVFLFDLKMDVIQ